VARIVKTVTSNKEKIGSGSNGAVFKCTTTVTNIHNNTDQQIPVALKFIVNDSASTSKIRNFYLNEYNILLHLPYHENIVQMLAHFVDVPTDELIAEFLKHQPGSRDLIFKSEPPLFDRETRMLRMPA
jgi:serine/threonine protein kinase